MSLPLNRREFVGRSLAAGALGAVAGADLLRGLTPVGAAEARLAPDRVRLNPDIEPLVRLIEETPRDRVIEAVAAAVRGGSSYQELLAAVFLAGVRGIQPRPVGFKFHAVLVINSAHQAALAAHDRDRWLPLFWAVDNFKASQARNAAEGNWSMPPVPEAQLPPAHQARQRFVEAMDNWDEEGADRAVAALVRTAGANDVVELFWRYGARDFRDIGHKAIYVANSWRTLQAIGWRHAEPVQRSLAYALLEHEGDNPARRDADPDRPWRENLKRVTDVRPDWKEGRPSPEAAADVLAALRQATPGDASQQVVALLNKGVHPSAAWDGVFLRAGELMLSQPGIVGLHAATSANALHYGYQQSSNDETRLLLLLQAAAFMTLFRDAMRRRGAMKDEIRVDALPKAEKLPAGPEAVEAILAAVGKDRESAARQTLALAEADPAAAEPLLAAARRLVFLKGQDSHDYKFSVAALEDYRHTAPAWRARYLAACTANLPGSSRPDNDLVRRTRAALGSPA